MVSIFWGNFAFIKKFIGMRSSASASLALFLKFLLSSTSIQRRGRIYHARGCHQNTMMIIHDTHGRDKSGPYTGTINLAPTESPSTQLHPEILAYQVAALFHAGYQQDRYLVV